MNLTLTTPRKPSKTAFIRLTSITPTQPPPSQHIARDSRKRRDECSSMFLVSCLNANASEVTQNSEMCEDYLIRQSPTVVPWLPDYQEERKCKIDVSLNRKTTQKQQTPRIQAISNKAHQISPAHLKLLNEENVSRLKMAGNSTISSSPQKNSKAALVCSCKHPLIVQQAEKANKQANNSFLPTYQQQQMTWTNINKQKGQFNQDTFNLAEDNPPYRNPQNVYLYNIEENHSIIQKSQSQHQMEHHQQATNFKEKLRDRRWIGEYAKTIKTFNASEQKENESQMESFVLQRGHHFTHSPIVAPINRGSIKDYRAEEETLKRAYGSVGQELHKAHLDPRFNRYIDQAIEEDIHDSDI